MHTYVHIYLQEKCIHSYVNRLTVIHIHIHIYICIHKNKHIYVEKIQFPNSFPDQLIGQGLWDFLGLHACIHS